MHRVWQLVIEHMQVPMFETHHSIYLHKYLNMFDHQQPHPVYGSQPRMQGRKVPDLRYCSTIKANDGCDGGTLQL